MNAHNPLQHILQYIGLFNTGDPDFSSLKSLCKLKIDEIKDSYHFNRHQEIDYNDINVQMAYMIYYFPNYIETIARVLQDIDNTKLNGSLKNPLDVCIYGGGPAPELYGFMAHTNSSFPEITSMRAHFFDKNDWEIWRQYCIQNMSLDYWGDKDFSSLSYFMDLCQLIDLSEFESFPIIHTADVHIIQNCGLDVITSLKCCEKFQKVFINLIRSVRSGSIIIIIDVVSFDGVIPGTMINFDLRASLQEIQRYVKNNDICEVLKQVSTYSRYEYNPVYIQYELTNREFPRKKFPVKYHALVLRKK
jgi:hypothetical protein